LLKRLDVALGRLAITQEPDPVDLARLRLGCGAAQGNEACGSE
jgi:hypothetical protein